MLLGESDYELAIKIAAQSIAAGMLTGLRMGSLDHDDR